MTSETDDGNFIYLRLGDALEIYAAIFKLTPGQAADHLRSQDALEGALGRPAATRVTSRPTWHSKQRY